MVVVDRLFLFFLRLVERLFTPGTTLGTPPQLDPPPFARLNRHPRSNMYARGHRHQCVRASVGLRASGAPTRATSLQSAEGRRARTLWNIQCGAVK